MSATTNTEPRPIIPGRLHVERLGKEGTVLVVGPLLDETIAATAGRDLTLLYATTVRPLDAAMLCRAAGTGPVIVVEPYLAGTSAHEVSEALADRLHRLHSIGVSNGEYRRYGHPKEHARAHGLDAEGIARSIDAFLSGARVPAGAY